jgi:Uma2 family endonuclease
MSITTFKWSIEQWHRLVETGVLANQNNVQLLEGEIVQMSPEGVAHSFVNRRIADYLRELLKGIAYISEGHPITLDNSEPQPDIAIVRLGEDIYSQHHPYPEDIYWLIEVSNSTLQFDQDTKAKIYARNNIPEYWIVDLINKKVIVYTSPKGNNYQQIEIYQTGTIIAQAFPNINIELCELLLF